MQIYRCRCGVYIAEPEEYAYDRSKFIKAGKVHRAVLRCPACNNEFGLGTEPFVEEDGELCGMSFGWDVQHDPDKDRLPSYVGFELVVSSKANTGYSIYDDKSGSVIHLEPKEGGTHG